MRNQYDFYMLIATQYTKNSAFVSVLIAQYRLTVSNSFILID